jgi:hypothetical protein
MPTATATPATATSVLPMIASVDVTRARAKDVTI